MGDFLHGQCSKGAGRTQNAIDSKFSFLHPTFKALSLPPSLSILIQTVYRYRGDSFLCGGLKSFNTRFIIRLLRNNKIKQLLGDSFSQLVKLQRL